MQQPLPIDCLLTEGFAAHRAGRIAEAKTAYRAILRSQPLHFDARHLLGVALRAEGRSAEAAAEIAFALLVNPANPDAYNNLANARNDLGDEAAARTALSRSLRLRPNFFEASFTLAQLTLRAGDVDGAIELFAKAESVAPSAAWRLYCRGRFQRAHGRLAEAAADLAEAAALTPKLPDIHANLGEALEALVRLPEALEAHRRSPPTASSLETIGRLLRRLFRQEEAAAALKSAFCLDPAARGAALHLAAALFDLRRFPEAHRWFSAARAIDPADETAFLGLFNTALYSCDWSRWEPLIEEALSRMKTGSSAFQPFSMLAASGDPSHQLLAARAYSAHLFKVRPKPTELPKAGYRHDRVRLGYLSVDFRNHAVAHLIAELIEVHDRERFEIFGFSYGPNDGSPLHQRLIDAFDQFHDVELKTDGEAAALIRANEIDILIDLTGYTQHNRAGILAYRPAPIQVNYLGFPGTLGSPFHDYVIADPILIPAGEEEWYSEKVIRLPGSYQANDGKRVLAATMPTREEEGLPEQGFVFCCFNNNWKISRQIFSLWMGLLREVPGSVLWLLGDNAAAMSNLREAAAQRGVDPARLIFAGRRPTPEHLARQRLADLFLDTLPYGAHTTASDALFAGLPLLTCTGGSFASRVATSLLTVIGVPELITTTLDDYAATASALASSPHRLREIREKLLTAPGRQQLFDAKEFSRGYEEALLSLSAL